MVPVDISQLPIKQTSHRAGYRNGRRECEGRYSRSGRDRWKKRAQLRAAVTPPASDGEPSDISLETWSSEEELLRKGCDGAAARALVARRKREQK
eukprot:5103662-Alexandrium_andersonii.AAC.1